MKSFAVSIACIVSVPLFTHCRVLAQPKDPSSDGAKPKASHAVSFECRWADAPLVIDGVADEADWKRAETISQFTKPWIRGDAKSPKTSTKARLLWDRQYLYFFAEMQDADLYADIKEHDGQTWYNDVFELFFKPADDKPGYYEFQVNAAGTIMDMFLPRRNSGGFRRYIKDGEFHIDAKVKTNGTLNKWHDKDKGWTVEGRIPWRDFLRTGGRPTIGEVWKFALCRYDYSVDFEGPELSTCAPLKTKTYADFHHFEDYASLKFVGRTLQQSRKKFGVGEFQPTDTSRLAGAPDPPLPYRAKRTLAKLAVNFPIFAIKQPESSRLWFIDQPRSYAPSRICRTTEEPESGEFETLLTNKGVAYSIAFHPQFEQNGFVFVGLNEARNGGPKMTRICRFTMREDHFLEDSEKVMIEWPSDGHNGGAIAFGLDGMMYITSGDGTSDSDTNLAGQRLDHLLAKVLRIDVDHPGEKQPYSVPPDNPFVKIKGARPETWAYGFRNPWRMSVDPKTGHLWVGNNGQDLWEQVFFVTRGANFGWSVYEGGHPFYLDRKLGPTPVSKPAADHPHSEARSLTGGIVYYGKKFPELNGAYIYGDYSTGKIWAMKHNGKRVVWQKEIADTSLQISSFASNAKGDLLITDHRGDGQGGFYALESNPDKGRDADAAFPKKLSETGLFKSVAKHIVKPSLIPYSVNAPLWSDGAEKHRYLALPKGAKIEFHNNRSWEFPDETIIVKSFSLATAEDKPESRRWIETRLLTKQQGEWVGYSYAWNDEQTDAVLVDRNGADREFEILVPAGRRKQTWHFPSRSECMVCHSRAAKFLLGLNTLQMNKEHDYGNVVNNQLRELEQLGLLRVNWLGEVKADLRKELKDAGKSDNEADQKLREITATRDQRTARVSSLLSKPPEKYPRLSNPYDAKEPLELRARAYLHSNCAQCHVEAGGGNAQIDLEFSKSNRELNAIDVKPLHRALEVIPQQRIIAPGHPERSTLLRRVGHRGRGQMPPLATSIVDEKAVKLLTEWILQLKPIGDGER